VGRGGHGGGVRGEGGGGGGRRVGGKTGGGGEWERRRREDRGRASEHGRAKKKGIEGLGEGGLLLWQLTLLTFRLNWGIQRRVQLATFHLKELQFRGRGWGPLGRAITGWIRSRRED